MKKLLFLVVPALVMSACTWVKLDKKGESVSVVQARYTKACSKLGGITAKVIVDVGGVKRSKNKVARELETLARNDAAEMGGDTIVIKSPVRTAKNKSFKKSASRKYSVYRCGAK